MSLVRHVRSNVVAFVALFVALGGVGYAAAGITGKDIVNNSIKGEDVKNRALGTRDLSPKAVKELRKPHQGTLPPGETLRGVYSIDDFSGATSSPSGEFTGGAVSYEARLAFDPVLQFMPAGSGADDNCPGTVQNPIASEGYLCVYEGTGANRDAGPVAFLFGDGRDRIGFGLSVLAQSNSPGLYGSFGSWALKAPRVF